MRSKPGTRGLLLVLLAGSAMALAACGGGESSNASSMSSPTAEADDEADTAASAQDATRTAILLSANATSTAIVGATATVEAAIFAEAEAAATPAAAQELTVKDVRFDKKVFVVPAGSTVQLTFVNEDGVAHNVAIFADAMYREKLASIDPVEGPVRRELSFEAPAPGTYYFICEPHRDGMYGRMIVK